MYTHALEDAIEVLQEKKFSIFKTMTVELKQLTDKNDVVLHPKVWNNANTFI